MTATTHSHRPTLKQQNKPFKSRHATKSAVKDAAKGKVARVAPQKASTQSNAAQLRLNRRNTAKLEQTKKRQSLISARRVFTGVDGAPRIVAVVPLCPDVTAKHAVGALARALGMDDADCPHEGLWKLRAERFKTSLQFVLLPYRGLYAALDACKAADYVVFVLSPTAQVEEWGELALRCLQAQGLPTVVPVVASAQIADLKKRPAILGSLLSFMQFFVPSQAKVFDLDGAADPINAVRSLCEGIPADVRWRDGRPWLLAEDVRFADSTLSVTGVVRGAGFSPDRLVHIPGFGDFQASQILSAALPRAARGGAAGMEVEPSVLVEALPSSAESLVSTNVPDTMANEQTWPTEEEMRDGAEAVATASGLPDAPSGTTPKSVRKVPKGTSAYQAAWIPDDGDENDASEDGEESDEEMEAASEAGSDQQAEIPEQDDDNESHRRVQFEDLEMEEDDAQLHSWRNREREERNDLQFPDEVDTPKDIPARTRFQRYRGLRSFRTSPWDPYENLPLSYARIFQFEDFKNTQRSVKRRAEEDERVVQPGTRVTVCLKDVPEEVGNSYRSDRPFVIFGLFQHEHKMSVLNFTVQRNTEYKESVRSKDPLILCVGPRRFATNPIFSQHTRGGGKGVNNVHKFERFLRSGPTSVATVFAPVVYGNQPCMFLRETSDAEAPHLVATGTFLNPDPTRIIAKRIVLTGHPFKVHKKTATIRYMFFNPEDVLYFAPVQLTTKHGRTGHIRESLGTHGYYKAHFDGPITQMDTVCMLLYKRVYPKWSHAWRGHASASIAAGDEMEE